MDNVVARANVTIEVREAATGRLVHREERHNMAVLAGRNLIRDALAGDAVTGLTHFAVGTGSAAVTATDTALGAEVLRLPIQTKTKDAAKLQIMQYLSSTQANGNTLTEAGLFNDPAAGTMYARVVHAGIVKTSALAVTYTWDLTWGV